MHAHSGQQTRDVGGLCGVIVNNTQNVNFSEGDFSIIKTKLASFELILESILVYVF